MGRVQATGCFAHRVSGRTTYLTPRWIIQTLGPFDLDPCASDPRPWPTAKTHLTGEEAGGVCGLKTPWKGLVWLNPPYGNSNYMDEFIIKLAQHPAGGIALLNTNTGTKVWQEWIFPFNSALLFGGAELNFATLTAHLLGARLAIRC